MNPRIVWPFLFLILAAMPSTVVAEGSDPPDRAPSAFGFSYSDLTGLGLTYRWLDAHQGWQVSAMGSTEHWKEGQQAWSLGAARQGVVFSESESHGFFVQLYWLAALSWRTESQKVTTSRWDPEAPGYYGPGTTIWESRTTWYQVLAAGPAIGLEAGALSHLSLNLEVGYRAAYDFAQSDTAKALALGPSFSAMVLFRF